MHYETHSDDGPVLVMVPGLAATAAFFDRAITELVPDHTVVTVDLPGHGQSPPNSGGATVDSAALALHGVLRELDRNDVTVLGWSLGATVAWTCLERYGTEGIDALVSVEQSPRLVADAGWPYPAFGSLDANGGQALVRAVDEDFPRFAEDLICGSFAADGACDANLVAELSSLAKSCDPRAVRGLLADVLALDWRVRIAGITVPTLLIHGGRSRVYAPQVGRWLAKALPDARLDVIEGAGHLCFVEEPGRFAGAVRDFVASRRTEGVR
jgi:pimeloyl-ACP methyl ester carboxylesterase